MRPSAGKMFAWSIVRASASPTRIVVVKPAEWPCASRFNPSNALASTVKPIAPRYLASLAFEALQAPLNWKVGNRAIQFSARVRFPKAALGSLNHTRMESRPSSGVGDSMGCVRHSRIQADQKAMASWRTEAISTISSSMERSGKPVLHPLPNPGRKVMNP